MPVREPKVNAHGAVPMRFQLYAEDVDALHEMHDAQLALGESSPSMAKIVRLAIRELARRSPEAIRALLVTTP